LTGSLGHCWGATDFRGDGAQLLALVRDIKPELVVTDIRMPPTHTTEGLDAAQVIRDEFPDIAILVLSAHVEVEHAMELLASGRGIGYLLKNRVTDVADFLDTLAIGAHSGGAPEKSSPSGCCTPWRAQSSAEAAGAASTRPPKSPRR
jgi:DNA-binding NarL/FixJ family response regulator